MKNSKAPLAMMEQVLMVLVFAIAAAVCLRVFVGCALGSRNIGQRSAAMSIASSMAEAIKSGDADMLRHYGIEFTPGRDLDDVPVLDGRDFEELGLRVSVKYGRGDRYLWNAEIVVSSKDGKTLERLPISGQVGG